MKDNKRIYLTILIGICFLALGFHLLILLKIIPYEITWGGKLKNDNEMYVFEIISIIINSFLFLRRLTLKLRLRSRLKIWSASIRWL